MEGCDDFPGSIISSWAYDLPGASLCPLAPLGVKIFLDLPWEKRFFLGTDALFSNLKCTPYSIVGRIFEHAYIALFRYTHIEPKKEEETPLIILVYHLSCGTLALPMGSTALLSVFFLSSRVKKRNKVSDIIIKPHGGRKY